MSLNSLEMSSTYNLRTSLILNEENWNDWSTKVKSRLNSESLLYTILYDKEEDCLVHVEFEDAKDMVEEMLLATKGEVAMPSSVKEEQVEDKSGVTTKGSQSKKAQGIATDVKTSSVDEQKRLLSFKKLIKLKKDKKVAAKHNRHWINGDHVGIGQKEHRQPIFDMADIMSTFSAKNTGYESTA